MNETSSFDLPSTMGRPRARPSSPRSCAGISSGTSTYSRQSHSTSERYLLPNAEILTNLGGFRPQPPGPVFQRATA
jgi:hypothetical protein